MTQTPSMTPTSSVTKSATLSIGASPSNQPLQLPSDVLANSGYTLASSVLTLSRNLLARPAPFLLPASACDVLLLTSTTEGVPGGAWAWRTNTSLESTVGSSPLLRVDSAEPVVLHAELWLVPATSTSPNGTAPVGSSRLYSASSALFYLPTDYSTGTVYANAANTKYGPGSSVDVAELLAARDDYYSGKTPARPSGLVLSPRAVKWTLVGVPVAPYWGLPAGACDPSLLHTITLDTGDSPTPLALVIPPGTLRAAYVYTASVDLASTLQGGWALDVGVLLAQDDARFSLNGMRSGVLNLQSLPQSYLRVGAGARFLTRLPPFGGALTVTSNAPLGVVPTELTSLFMLNSSPWLSEWAWFTPLSSAAASALKPAVTVVLALGLPFPELVLSAFAQAAAGLPTSKLITPALACSSAQLGLYLRSEDVSSNSAVLPLPPDGRASTLAAMATVLLTASNTLMKGALVSAPLTEVACAALAQSASNVTSLLYPMPPSVSQAVQISFRVASSGGAPIPSSLMPVYVPGSLAAILAVSALQVALRSPITWPGVPLAEQSVVTQLSKTQLSISFSSPAANAVSNSTDNTTATGVVLNWVIAADADGGIGLAWSSSPLQAFATPAQLQNSQYMVSAVTNSTAALGNGSANPYATLYVASTLATLLQESIVLSTATTASQTDAVSTRASLLIAVGGAVGAINVSSDSGGIRVDDATLDLTISTLTLLNSVNNTLGMLASTVATASSVLSLATTSAGIDDATTAAATTVPAFPVDTGAAVLSLLLAVTNVANDSTTLGALVGSTLPVLGSAVLRSASVGAPPTSITAGPPSAYNGTAGFCGAALSMTVSRVAVGEVPVNASLENPIRPCSNTTAAPAPYVSLSAGFTASAADTLGSPFALDLHVVQWGQSPVPPTAGWNALTYPAKGNGTCSEGVIGGDGGEPSQEAAVMNAVNAAVRGECSTLSEYKPSHGLDTRVTSFTLSNAQGVVGNGAGSRVLSAKSTDASPSVLFSLPVAPQTSPRPPQTVLLSCPSAVNDGTGNWAPPPNSTLATLTAGLIAVRSPGGARMPSTVLRELTVNVTVPTTLVNVGAPKYVPPNLGPWAPAFATTNTTIFVTRSTVLYVVRVDCGAGVPPSFASCGYGAYNTTVTILCVPPTPTPVCGWWDVERGAWSTDGCIALGVSPDGATLQCECTHLTDFAGRFSELGSAQVGIFSEALRLADGATFTSAPYVLYLVGTLVALMVISLCAGLTSDARSEKRFLTSLSVDTELSILARIAALRGVPFVLDRCMAPPPPPPTPEFGEEGFTVKSPLPPRPRMLAESGEDDPDAPALLEAKLALSGVLAPRLCGLAPDEEEPGGPDPLDRPSRPHVDPFAAAVYLRLVNKYDRFRVTTASLRTALGDLPSQAREAVSTAMLSHDSRSGTGGAAMPSTDEWEQGPDGTPVRVDAERAAHASRVALMKKIRLAMVELRAGTAADLPTTTQTAAASSVSALDTAPTAVSSLAAGATRPVALAAKTLDSIATAGVSLDDSSASFCARLCRLRGFLSHVWWLQLFFHHSLLSAANRFDPRLSRASRVTVLILVLLGNLFVSAFLYNWRAKGEARSDGLAQFNDFGDVLLIGAVSALLQFPITRATILGLRWAGASQFVWRYPALAQELERRRRLEAKLGRIHGELLRRQLVRNKVAKAEECGSQTGHISDSTPPPNPPHHGTPRHADPHDEQLELGWIEPPPCCTACCPCLLYACSRHASQRDAWLARKKAAAAARRAAARLARFKRRESSRLSQEGASNALSTNRRGLGVETADDWEAGEDSSDEEALSRIAGENHRGPIDLAQTAFEAVLACACGACFSRMSDCRRTKAPSPVTVPAEGVIGIERVYLAAEKEASSAVSPPLTCRFPGCPRRCTWTCRSLSVYGAVYTYVVFCTFYILLWSLYEPEEVVITFISIWAISQAIFIVLIEPLFIYLALVSACIVWPAVAPLLLWIPRLGPMVVSTLAPASASDTLLSGRMENLTLLRAAGFASMLTPDAAVVAFAANAVFTSILGGLGDLLSRRLRAKSKRASKKNINSLEGLDAEERYELVVKSYLRFALAGAARAQVLAKSDGVAQTAPQTRASPPTSPVSDEPRTPPATVPPPRMLEGRGRAVDASLLPPHPALPVRRPPLTHNVLIRSGGRAAAFIEVAPQGGGPRVQ